MTSSPYRWLSQLGTGSSGEVWAAVRDGREIAVKVLKSRPGSAHAEALRREMRLGPILSGHPGIIAVQNVEDVNGALHLEMEWVRGPSLADLLQWRKQQGQPPVPPSLAIPWAIQVLEALDWAGSRVAPTRPSSFVHRDIKPANLLIDTDGRLRITDFGIARAEAELGFQTTHTGIVKGSPRYMAPEILSEATVDARADQFSLGAVLYQLLTGEPLYRGRDLASTLIEALEADVRPRLDAYDGPLRIRKAMTTMLAKNPSHRFTNHRVAADSLRALRLGGPTVQAVIPELLSAVRVEAPDPAGPSMSRLPDLGSMAQYPTTGTDAVVLAADTMDLPSLELDPLVPDLAELLADREIDRGDTVPLKRPGGAAPVPLAVSRQRLDAELANFAMDRDDVTAPIPIHEDEEDTVLKSMDEIARELGMLGLDLPSENTVASIDLPEATNPSTTDIAGERTVVLPEPPLVPAPPPRTSKAPPSKTAAPPAPIPIWVYGAVGCSVFGLALAVVIVGVAVGLVLANL